MPESFVFPYLQEVVIFLCVTALIVPFFNRFKVNPILGFLAMGMILGPFGLGHYTDIIPSFQYITMSDNEGIHVLAELGIVFLMFSIGLELSSSRLWAMRKYVFGMGTMQILSCSLVVGLIAHYFGNDAQSSILIGAALSLSSTAVVMKLLIDRNKLTSPLGQSSFSILLMQDLAVVPILFLVSFLSNEGNTAAPLYSLSLALGQAIGAVAIILLFGRYLLRPLFSFAAINQSREMFMATVLLIVITTSALSAMAGMSMAVGAFLAGLMLSETEYSNQVEVDIEPFRGLLLGLFFLSIGMQINIAYVLSNIVFIAISVIGLMAIKTILIFLCARLFKIPPVLAAGLGLTLSGTGEFAFVILEPAMNNGLVPYETAQFMMIVATLCIFITPILFELVVYLSKQKRYSDRSQYSFATTFKDSLTDHVIIAGYGRVGQTIANFTGLTQMPYIAIDTDGELCTRMRKQGVQIYFGDASHWHVLRKINADRAKAVIVTQNSSSATLRTVKAINQFNPHITIIARAKDKEHAEKLREAGATHVVHETVEMSLQMGSKLLSLMGFTTDAILNMAEKTRDLEYGANLDECTTNTKVT